MLTRRLSGPDRSLIAADESERSPVRLICLIFPLLLTKLITDVLPKLPDMRRLRAECAWLQAMIRHAAQAIPARRLRFPPS